MKSYLTHVWDKKIRNGYTLYYIGNMGCYDFVIKRDLSLNRQKHCDIIHGYFYFVLFSNAFDFQYERFRVIKTVLFGNGLMG